MSKPVRSLARVADGKRSNPLESRDLTVESSMKHVLAIAATVLLAGCATSGMKDTLPKLSSKSDKTVTAYVQCVLPKWQALAPDAKGDAKEDKGTVNASKDGAYERLEITASGSGSQVVMYELQKVKGDYNGSYREEAISCLSSAAPSAPVIPSTPVAPAAPTAPSAPATPATSATPPAQ